MAQKTESIYDRIMANCIKEFPKLAEWMSAA